MRELRGKRAVVTGAASGIGRAIARALAAEGTHLVLIDIDETHLAQVVEETGRLGVDAIGLRCDLAQSAEIADSVRAIQQRVSAIDLLVNNAGVAYYGPTEKMTAEQWDWLLAVNLHAPIRLTCALLPQLLSRPEAHVLNVCSIAGLIAWPRCTAYHVSKFGLIGFSEALRSEYGRRGLGVTALCPGPVHTNLYRAALNGSKRPQVPLPPRWLCATPEKVACRAVRAIRRNRRLVLVTWLAHVQWQVKRFAPWLLDAVQHLSRRRWCERAVPAPAER